MRLTGELLASTASPQRAKICLHVNEKPNITVLFCCQGLSSYRESIYSLLLSQITCKDWNGEILGEFCQILRLRFEETATCSLHLHSIENGFCVFVEVMCAKAFASDLFGLKSARSRVKAPIASSKIILVVYPRVVV